MPLHKAEILVHRVPVKQPVRTSFGTMHDRPSVLLRIEDTEGHAGWGEIWCNYPAVGAEHRARLLASTVLPLASGFRHLDRPEDLWSAMTDRLRVLAIQTGEPGPLAQCLAGFECALQDLAARRAGQPLWRHLSPSGSPQVAVYASGINPAGAPAAAREAADRGYAGCKIKIGFDAERDRENLIEARTLLGDGFPLMADANQAWSLDEALAFSQTCDAVGLAWLEEPLAHDAPDAAWQALAGSMATPLAAGENFGTDTEFETLPERRRLSVLQPDLGKWGGVGRSAAVARLAAERGLTFCPHWLGGGVGLLASLHVKASTGDPTGYVEVDFNANPMREDTVRQIFDGLKDGSVRLPEAPGIGEVEDSIRSFSGYCVHREEMDLS